MNFKTQKLKPLYTFDPELNQQPTFLQISEDQSILVVASLKDCRWVNLKTNHSYDLDSEFSIDFIREIKYDSEDKTFYLLANKRKEKLGFYLMRINQDEPTKTHKYLTLWRNKLDIADANIFIERGKDSSSQDYKELVVSYKTIYINTYNVLVYDISVDEEKQVMLYRHESFQLWESKVSGLILSKNKDFVSLSKAGINVLSLGSLSKRGIKDHMGQNKMLHSLDSLSYLKVDQVNSITFECQDYNNRVISIE